MSDPNFFEIFSKILEAQGTVEPFNPITMSCQFKDEKLTLTGLLEQSFSPDNPGWVYTKFYVFINSPWRGFFQTPLPPNLWGMPVDPKTAPVYFGLVKGNSTEDVLYIGGIWINYLDRIFKRIQKQTKGIEQYHQSSIDDEELFPKGSF
jgi:hypothetical protein